MMPFGGQKAVKSKSESGSDPSRKSNGTFYLSFDQDDDQQKEMVASEPFKDADCQDVDNEI